MMWTNWKKGLYPKKCLCDGSGSTETASHDGDDVEGFCDSDTKVDPPEDGMIDIESNGSSFKLHKVDYLSFTATSDRGNPP